MSSVNDVPDDMPARALLPARRTCVCSVRCISVCAGSVRCESVESKSYRGLAAGEWEEEWTLSWAHRVVRVQYVHRDRAGGSAGVGIVTVYHGSGSQRPRRVTR